MYSSRRLYLDLKQSPKETFNNNTRFLATSSTRESEMEKPYNKLGEYQSMHLDDPAPGVVTEDLPSLGAINCVYDATDCSVAIYCYPDFYALLETGPAHRQQGFVLPPLIFSPVGDVGYSAELLENGAILKITLSAYEDGSSAIGTVRYLDSYGRMLEVKIPLSCPNLYTWRDTTSTTWWTATSGSWNGSIWTPLHSGSYYNLGLSEAGTWNVGYAPTHLRVTYSGAGGSLPLTFKNQYNQDILIDGQSSPVNIVSGTSYSIALSGAYINTMYFSKYNASYTVSKIEFYGYHP